MIRRFIYYGVFGVNLFYENAIVKVSRTPLKTIEFLISELNPDSISY
jgi:hypothetical protein